ncbi:hypothetical protein AGMMS50239_38020 [Bacteroidia bacterium]|nr:hypothetical protein AGMMS50239_38020 [Bacteroidia bacterium]GHU13485.1 hypothetical protein FACS189441_1050 [Betaproteobacteria bacterium]GHU68066.1 hypothetical protein FACS189413_04100 [Bacteroidia bacterium]
METGNIKIKENDKQQFVVNVKLVNGNLWLSTCQMADLFNTYEQTVENNIRAIFQTGILCEKDVARIQQFEHKGRICETTLYNMDVIIYISYRIPSFESRAFREWLMKAFCKPPFMLSLN